MRALALLGGMAIVAATAALHRPSADRPTTGQPSSSDCTAPGSGTFCDAVVGLSKALHDPILPFNHHQVLPPRETPGAVDPTITQANIGDTICRPGYARSARPPYSVTGPLKRQLMQTEHPGEPLADYELDHLIPISIGGAPFDRRDLWLQPRRGQANAGDKNILAYVLWRLVCRHEVLLATAQHDISHDWTRAYETYATPDNIDRFHFRHPERDGG